MTRTTYYIKFRFVETGEEQEFTFDPVDETKVEEEAKAALGEFDVEILTAELYNGQI